jgi:hypothetical protein
VGSTAFDHDTLDQSPPQQRRPLEPLNVSSHLSRHTRIDRGDSLAGPRLIQADRHCLFIAIYKNRNNKIDRQETKLKAKSLSILTIATATLLIAFPIKQAFCQDSAAGQEMHQSGQALRGAGSDAADSVKHAYRGTADQMSDATLTTKVKSALHSDHRTRKYSIHVESDQGKVTIDGAVPTHSDAKYVKTVVAAVGGVRIVDSKLTWPTS